MRAQTKGLAIQPAGSWQTTFTTSYTSCKRAGNPSRQPEDFSGVGVKEDAIQSHFRLMGMPGQIFTSSSSDYLTLFAAGLEA
uniref:Uncharacterized protein n=1 Tax=Ditylenchus dipsaci TaxID=166011 RepID=A0A915E941_9BILA